MKEIKMNTHIFPFLWMHGEPHAQIEREIAAIYDCGIRMFCVESRPHPEFCEEGWWRDLGFVLETAKKRGMKVWVLDDKHFPTGYANGIVEKYPHLKQKYVKAVPTDFIGNGEVCRFVLNALPDDIPFAAFVYKRSDKGHGLDLESGVEIDLSESLQDGVLTLPAGFFGHCRIIILYQSSRFSEFANYIDMLNPESAALQIKAVYEPHYERLSAYFGDTLIGFFSDEPRFG
ncbi:MAG: glycoside hydrolase family 2, partial [Clostridia bacterium]|nr:glycoside hydrolase family 2 [Clostridia bacterium]